jgi:hypothetical protein
VLPSSQPSLTIIIDAWTSVIIIVLLDDDDDDDDEDRRCFAATTLAQVLLAGVNTGFDYPAQLAALARLLVDTGAPPPAPQILRNSRAYARSRARAACRCPY